MGLTQLKTGAIADDAVTTDKLANAINTERTANTAKVSLGADSVTGAKIADDAVGAEHIEQLDADLSFADSAKAKFGTGNDLEISHDGSNSKIHHGGDGGLKVTCDDFQVQKNDGSEWIMRGQADGAVELYHNNSKKFETGGSGIVVTGTIGSDGIYMGDDERAKFGAGDDLQVYHDGSHSYITRPNGSDGQLLIRANHSDNGIVMSNDGAVELFHDGTKKLSTTANGICFNSDTAAANALDDYEEGNWTPAVGAGGWTINSTSFAKYVKVASLVTVWCYITFGGTGNSDALLITGLPFTIASDNYSPGSLDVGNGGVKGAYSRTEGHTSGTVAFFYPSENTGSSRIALTGNQVAANYCIFTIQYFTSA